MTNTTDDIPSSGTLPKTHSDGDLHRLLARAGRRPEPPAGSTDRAYAQLNEEWQEHVKQHKARRRHRYLLASTSIAATVLIAFVGVFLLSGSTTDAWQLRVAAGSVLLDANTISAPADVTLQTDHEFVATSAVRFETTVGTELRLAENTRGRWLDANSLFLRQGSVYVDTGGTSDFAIFTEQATVRDIGTRYMVEVAEGRLSVAVREGVVAVQSDEGIYNAVATERTAALVQIDRGSVVESIESKADPRWAWIHSVPAGYVSRSVPVVLSQIARDLGKAVIYSGRGVEATISNDIVQGSLDAMPPRQALQLVMHSANLSWVEDSNTITIDFIR